MFVSLSVILHTRNPKMGQAFRWESDELQETRRPCFISRQGIGTSRETRSGATHHNNGLYAKYAIIAGAERVQRLTCSNEVRTSAWTADKRRSPFSGAGIATKILECLVKRKDTSNCDVCWLHRTNSLFLISTFQSGVN